MKCILNSYSPIPTGLFILIYEMGYFWFCTRCRFFSSFYGVGKQLGRVFTYPTRLIFNMLQVCYVFSKYSQCQPAIGVENGVQENFRNICSTEEARLNSSSILRFDMSMEQLKV